MIDTTTIRMKRGSQWDRCQIRSCQEGGWVHGKKKLKNDRDHNDQGEERNPMG
jgi:hypothetical protein